MTVSLKDLFVAKVSTDAEGVDTYAAPERLAKAIKADINVKVAEATLYADDGADAVEKEFVSLEMKLNTNDLSPQMRSKVLGQKIDADGVVYGGANDDAPYFAVGFRARKRGKTYIHLWYYRVKFGVPSESYETKGENISFKTPEIIGTGMKRHDGSWKADYTATEDDPIAAAWFDTVREPAEEPTLPPTPPPEG